MILFEMICNIDIGIDFIDNILNDTASFFNDVEKVTNDEVSKATARNPEMGGIFSKVFDSAFLIIGILAFFLVLFFFGWIFAIFMFKGILLLIYKMYKSKKRQEKRSQQS